MCSKLYFTLLLNLTVFYKGCECANILGICQYPSPSHHILGSALLKELANRGHNVTVLSPYSINSAFPNYKEIILPYILDIKEEMIQPVLHSDKSQIEKTSAILDAALRITEATINNVPVQNLLKSDAEFDLVLIVWGASEPFLGFAHRFSAPAVVLNPLGSGPMTNYLTDNPSPYAYVPYLMLPFTDRMSFMQRTVNTIASFVGDKLTEYVAYSQHAPLLDKYFPDNPGLETLVKNIALVLLNSHYTIETPRPFVPNTIQIGGFHIQEPRELNQDLKAFLDNAKEGVILFSLGSNLKSTDLSPEKLQSILRVFERIPQNILWKWETDNLPNQPKNVKIVKWLPQCDILAHPNVKLFITHGGLLSIMESVHHAVPFIGIPFFGDQKSNLVGCVTDGYCLMLQHDMLNEIRLYMAITEITQNSTYRENIQRKSALFRDQPIKPMDKAVFWIEHVLKHGNGQHLRTAASNLSWYQILLLDVIAFLIGIVVVLVFVLYLLVKIILKCCKRKTFAQKIKKN